MFLVSVTYTKGLEAIDRHLEAHVAFLRDQYAKGHFVMSGRKIPRTGGIIISCVSTRQELEEILAQDPFARNDVASYDITEFVSSLVAPGLERFKQ